MSAPVAAPRTITARRTKRGWQGLGIALVVLGVLASLWMANKYLPQHSYLAMTRTVAIGQQITAADLTTVRINAAPGLTPIDAIQIRTVIGKTAAVELTAGTLLTSTQITDTPVPPAGHALIGIGLPKDRFPGQRLKAGDPVQLVATSGSNTQAGESSRPPQTFTARVHRVSELDNRGDVLVDLIVTERDAPLIADLAAANRLVIMRVAAGA